MSFIRLNEEIEDISNLDIPLDIISIELCSCSITEINPDDFFLKFTRLETINLQNNKLTRLNFIIQPSVTYIDISNNYLDKGVPGLRNKDIITVDIPDTLETIITTGNPYHFVIELQNAGIVINGNGTHYNPRMGYPNLVKKIRHGPAFYDSDDDDDDDNAVNKPAGNVVIDVHHSQIQDNIRKSIEYLMKQSRNKHYIIEMIRMYEKPNFIKDMFLNSRITGYKLLYSNSTNNSWGRDNFDVNIKESFGSLLIYYDSFTNELIYDYSKGLVTTMSRILEAIWAVTKNSVKCMDILESLFGQMKDGKLYCFVGKYTRVINSLSTFDSNIMINDITTEDKIRNKIEQLKAKEITCEEIKKELKEYMDELKVPDTNQQPWLDALDDLYIGTQRF